MLRTRCGPAAWFPTLNDYSKRIQLYSCFPAALASAQALGDFRVFDLGNEALNAELAFLAIEPYRISVYLAVTKMASIFSRYLKGLVFPHPVSSKSQPLLPVVIGGFRDFHIIFVINRSCAEWSAGLEVKVKYPFCLISELNVRHRFCYRIV